MERKRNRMRQVQKEARRKPEESSLAGSSKRFSNRAVQRLLQRQAFSPTQPAPAPNVLDPRLLASAAQKVINQAQAPVRSWLEANTENLRQKTMEELVARVRQNVPEAAKLADVEIQYLAREWAASKNIIIPVIPPAGTVVTDPTLQIPDAVKKAFSIAVDGVNVVRLPGGKLNIAAKGATAKLGGAEVGISWSGSVGIDVPGKWFHLSGKYDKEAWEINLTTPGESAMPDLASLAEVFRKAETGLREAVSATAKLDGLDDPSKVAEAISPGIKPVKEAVEALQKVAESPRVSFGITASGPSSKEKPPGGQPGGVTVTATLTIRF